MKKYFDVAYILTNGFASRMVTQTDLLGKISSNGLQVAIITPDKNDPNLKDYAQSRGISIFEFNAKNSPFSTGYFFKRKYFLDDIKANPALWEKHVHDIHTKSRNPYKKLRPLFYLIIYYLIKIFPFIRTRFVKTEKKYLVSYEAEKIIDTINPQKLVSTYPVDYNEALLLHYGNRNPNTTTWIHLLSWDNITCKGRFPEIAKKYISWGPIMTNELQEYYNIDTKNIYECGVPHFDLHIEVQKSPDIAKYLTQLGLQIDIPYVFFAMSSPRFSPGEIEIVEWLADIIEKRKLNLQMIVRPHPQNVSGNMMDKTWLPRLNDLGKLSKIAIDYPEINNSNLLWSMPQSDMIKLSNLIYGAQIILNSGSTISIDALLHDKPVIITSFDGNHNFTYWKSARRLINYTHLKKLISYKGIDVVYNYEELYNTINYYLTNNNYKLENRILSKEMECLNKIGYSATDNVVSALS